MDKWKYLRITDTVPDKKTTVHEVRLLWGMTISGESIVDPKTWNFINSTTIKKNAKSAASINVGVKLACIHDAEVTMTSTEVKIDYNYCIAVELGTSIPYTREEYCPE